MVTSTTPRRLDGGNVNLVHLHHGLEGASRCLGVGIAYRLDEDLRVICQEMPHLS